MDTPKRTRHGSGTLSRDQTQEACVRIKAMIDEAEAHAREKSDKKNKPARATRAKQMAATSRQRRLGSRSLKAGLEVA